MSDLAKKMKEICEKAARFKLLPNPSEQVMYKLIDHFNNNRDVCKSIEEAEKLSLETLEECATNWFMAWSGTYKLALYPAEQVMRDANPANGGF